jgi:hypothetical protein
MKECTIALVVLNLMAFSSRQYKYSKSVTQTKYDTSTTPTT